MASGKWFGETSRQSQAKPVKQQAHRNFTKPRTRSRTGRTLFQFDCLADVTSTAFQAMHPTDLTNRSYHHRIWWQPAIRGTADTSLLPPYLEAGCQWRKLTSRCLPCKIKIRGKFGSGEKNLTWTMVDSEIGNARRECLNSFLPSLHLSSSWDQMHPPTGPNLISAEHVLVKFVPDITSLHRSACVLPDCSANINFGKLVNSEFSIIWRIFVFMSVSFEKIFATANRCLTRGYPEEATSD